MRCRTVLTQCREHRHCSSLLTILAEVSSCSPCRLLVTHPQECYVQKFSLMWVITCDGASFYPIPDPPSCFLPFFSNHGIRDSPFLVVVGVLGNLNATFVGMRCHPCGGVGSDYYRPQLTICTGAPPPPTGDLGLSKMRISQLATGACQMSGNRRCPADA
jgi:hypothetical protein